MKKKQQQRLKLYFPGDKGYDPKYPYPWAGVGKLAGLDQTPRVEISGFYVIDRRKTPNVAIFSNCQVPMVVGIRPALSEMPKPWRSPGEALEYIKRLHLSEEEEEMCIKGNGPLKIVAMAPDPGMGYPKPDTLIMSKKDFNNW